MRGLGHMPSTIRLKAKPARSIPVSRRTGRLGVPEQANRAPHRLPGQPIPWGEVEDDRIVHAAAGPRLHGDRHSLGQLARAHRQDLETSVVIRGQLLRLVPHTAVRKE